MTLYRSSDDNLVSMHLIVMYHRRSWFSFESEVTDVSVKVYNVMHDALALGRKINARTDCEKTRHVYLQWRLELSRVPLKELAA